MGCRNILLHFLVAIYILERNAVYGISASFDTFLKNVKEDTKCGFPPNVFGGEENRYKFETCLDNTDKRTRQQTDLCESVVRLSEKVCSLTINGIFVDQSIVLTRVWRNESSVNITQRVDQICDFLHLSISGQSGDCQKDCYDSFYVCDVYYAMKKSVVETFYNRLKDASGMETVDSFFHTLNDVFPYPPVGSMHTSGHLSPCLKGEMDICDAVKELAYKIANSGIKVDVETMLQRMHSSDPQICNKFQTMPEKLLSSEVWLSLHATNTCKEICNDEGLNICYSLFLGLLYLKQEVPGAYLGEEYKDESQQMTPKINLKDGDLMNEIKTKSKNDNTNLQKMMQNNITKVVDETVMIKDKEGSKNESTSKGDDTQFKPTTLAEGAKNRPTIQDVGTDNEQTIQDKVHHEHSNQSEVVKNASVNQEVEQIEPIYQDLRKQNKSINQDKGVKDEKGNKEGKQNETTNKADGVQKNKEITQGNSIEKVGNKEFENKTLNIGTGTQNMPSVEEVSKLVEQIKNDTATSVDSLQNQNNKTVNYPSSEEGSLNKIFMEGDEAQNDVTLQGDGAQNQHSYIDVNYQNHEKDQENKKSFTPDRETQDKAEIGPKIVSTGRQLYKLNTETTTSATKAMMESDAAIFPNDEEYGKEDEDSPRKRPNSSSMQHEEVEENATGGMGFMSYFLVFTVLCVAGYIVFHNKQKIIALVIEGKNIGNGRRPSSKEYRRLKTEDVMPSLERSTMATNYVY